jgi:hypothetical protein
MMRGQRFKINQALDAIDPVEKGAHILHIPKGSVVTIVAGPVDNDRLIDISWDGHVLMIFMRDLLERAERIAD